MARFVEVYKKWCRGQVTQVGAAKLLGVSERTFRRDIIRFRSSGVKGLEDGRVARVSHRRAPLDEVSALVALYTEEYAGWKVRPFYKQYRGEHGGQRSYTWVKDHLQAVGLVERKRRTVDDRERQPRKLAEGMMIHQDASTYEWAPGRKWDAS